MNKQSIKISINKEFFQIVKKHLNAKGIKFSNWISQQITNTKTVVKLNHKHPTNYHTTLSLSKKVEEKLNLILSENEISLKDYVDILLSNYVAAENLDDLVAKIPSKVSGNISKISFRVNEELYRNVTEILEGTEPKVSFAELLRRLIKDFFVSYESSIELLSQCRKMKSPLSITVAIPTEDLQKIQKIGLEHKISIQDLSNFMLKDFLENC